MRKTTKLKFMPLEGGSEDWLHVIAAISLESTTHLNNATWSERFNYR